MYADDTEMEGSCKPEDSIRLETNLNSDLSGLKGYFSLNRLSINVAKCEFMLIGTYQALQKILNINVHIDGEPMNRVSVTKYVGMYIYIPTHRFVLDLFVGNKIYSILFYSIL